MKENQILGNLIQQMRKEMKMRSVDAAKLMGISDQGNYSRLENYGIGFKPEYFIYMRAAYKGFSKAKIEEYEMRIKSHQLFLERLDSYNTILTTHNN